MLVYRKAIRREDNPFVWTPWRQIGMNVSPDSGPNSAVLLALAFPGLFYGLLDFRDCCGKGLDNDLLVEGDALPANYPATSNIDLGCHFAGHLQNVGCEGC
jgi:hypothetical protein